MVCQKIIVLKSVDIHARVHLEQNIVLFTQISYNFEINIMSRHISQLFNTKTMKTGKLSAKLKNYNVISPFPEFLVAVPQGKNGFGVSIAIINNLPKCGKHIFSLSEQYCSVNIL